MLFDEEAGIFRPIYRNRSRAVYSRTASQADTHTAVIPAKAVVVKGCKRSNRTPDRHKKHKSLEPQRHKEKEKEKALICGEKYFHALWAFVFSRIFNTFKLTGRAKLSLLSIFRRIGCKTDFLNQ